MRQDGCRQHKKQRFSPAYEEACTYKKSVGGLRNQNRVRYRRFDTLRNVPDRSHPPYSDPFHIRPAPLKESPHPPIRGGVLAKSYGWRRSAKKITYNREKKKRSERGKYTNKSLFFEVPVRGMDKREMDFAILNIGRYIFAPLPRSALRLLVHQKRNISKLRGEN